MPVAEREEGHFLALQKLLDDKVGLARAVQGERIHRPLGLVKGHCDGDALPARQAVGLDDDRRSTLSYVGDGRRAHSRTGDSRPSECRIRGRSPWRNPFDPSSWAARREGPKQAMPAAARSSDNSGDERRLRADDDEIDGLITAERDDLRVVVQIQGCKGGDLRATGVAGRDEKPPDIW